MSPRLSFLTASMVLAAAAFGACSATRPGDSAAKAKTAIMPEGLAANPLAWPAITETNKPWTRWWWMGSAVSPAEITRQLGLFQKAGEGGVEICPIYGVKGNEANDIQFLSPKWVDMLAHTTEEGKRLGMGVDLTTGTGWPFGGPMVPSSDASSALQWKKFSVGAGQGVTGDMPRGTVQYVCSVAPDGTVTDITASYHDGKVDWTAPASGSYTVYVLAQQDAIQQVKRSAPGGEGNVLDPYSPEAMAHYLAFFDKSFAAAGYSAPRPRSEFHDSFEYYGANWTDDFFAEFQKRRGYDLRAEVPALLGDGPADRVARVRCDYRETISDLHLSYMRTWVDWAHGHGELTRNQAHGSPANILDAYAVSDIPECEIFHLYEEGHIPFLRLANSAAHVTGKRLASSESFTWLGDHFAVSLADVKSPADFLFITGVNHIFFHGTPYSPASAAWPGFNFYAAVNFGPNGGMFHDIDAMNAYIARCQSILQANKPGSDVLLYMPFYEVWQDQHLTPNGPGSGQSAESMKQTLMYQFTTPGDWMKPFPFYKTAMELFQKGYAYDEVSDKLLEPAQAENGDILLGGNRYKAIVIPESPVFPVETMRKLVELQKGGAKIVFLGKMPGDVPGFKDVDARRQELAGLTQQLEGKVATGDSAQVDELLAGEGVRREQMMDQGIRFARRFRSDGVDYFLVNRSDKAVDGWVPLATGVSSAVLLNPLYGGDEGRAEYAGRAAIRHSKDSAEVYLQLAPGQSCILRTSGGERLNAPAWKYVEPGTPEPIPSTWKVHFTEKLDQTEPMPADFSTSTLSDYTGRGDAYKSFAGTAVYSTTFEAPSSKAQDYYLDLGKVGDSARVTLNGHFLGTLWCAPFRVRVGEALHPGQNSLQIEVTNIAQNRIRDFDQRGVVWKIYKDINVVNIKHGTAGDYVPMNAAEYPERPAGLLEPVKLVPLTIKTPE
ncbi:MAG TPA: glycosyl hydrolase [Phycisphaerae bacterium]|nr:glycosyl hydrolase [Phycisphaerae bacterium]